MPSSRQASAVQRTAKIPREGLRRLYSRIASFLSLAMSLAFLTQWFCAAGAGGLALTQGIRQQTGYYLTDMQSSNGVLVNDEQLAEPRLLRTGDIIRIGEVTLVCEASGEALPASPPTHPLADATIAFARSGFDATTLTSDIQPRLPAPTPATEQLSCGER